MRQAPVDVHAAVSFPDPRACSDAPRARRVLAVALLVLAACAPRNGPADPTQERLLWVNGGGGRLRVSDGGRGGTAVVFVHGMGSDRGAWAGQLVHLRATRRAIAYDQRGHGDSARAQDGDYGFEALAADLEAVRRALGLERMVLVGHSMAGGVLTTYAGRHPEAVAGLVYLDALGDVHAYPASTLKPWIEQAQATRGAAARRAAFADDLKTARPATREAVLAALDRLDDAAFGKLNEAYLGLRDGRQRLAPYHGPTLAIEAQGNHGAELASAALGVKRVEVAGTSHWIQLDDPDAVNRYLELFLAQLPKR